MLDHQYIQYLRSLPKVSQKVPRDAESADVKLELGELEQMLKAKSKEIEAALNNITNQAGLNALMATFQGVADKVAEVAKQTLILDKIYGSLTKSLGVTSREAVRLGTSLANVATQFGVGQQQAVKYLASFQKVLPGYSKIITGNENVSKSFTDIQTALSVNMGLSDQQVQDIVRFTGVAGENAKNSLSSMAQFGKAAEKATDIVGAQKQILEGVAAAGASAQIQFGRIPGSLELAVLKSNQLGLSIQDLSNVGNTLLNIEQSVSDELEYQLLSGRKLVKDGRSLTNEYRQAFLSGEADKQADILQEIISSQGDVLKNNVLARQQLAKTLGMEEKQLSEAIQMEDLRNELRLEGIVKSGKEIQDLFDLDRNEFLAKIESDPELRDKQAELVKQFDKNLTESEKIEFALDTIYTKGILEIIKRMDSDQNPDSKRPVSDVAAEVSQIGKLTEAIEKVLVGEEDKTGAQKGGLLEGIADKALSGESTIENIGQAAIFSKFAGSAISTVLSSFSQWAGQAASIVTDKLSADFNATGKTVKLDDFILTDSGQIIQPNSQDTIMGFKPGGPIDKAMQGGGSLDVNQFAAAVVNAFRQVSINVNMNTKAMATAIESEIAMNQYQRMT